MRRHTDSLTHTVQKIGNIQFVLFYNQQAELHSSQDGRQKNYLVQ